MGKIVLRSRALRTIYRELAGLPLPPNVKKIKVNSHEVVEVTFTDEQAEFILERAKSVDEEAKFNVLVNEACKIGFLGQCAFYLWAYADEERFKQIQVGWNPDITDVIYKGWHIDVKTRSKPWYDYLLVEERRFKKKSHDFCVGCRLMSENPYVVEIWGYATLEELECVRPRWWPKTLSRSIDFDELYPVAKLKDLEPKGTTLG